MLLAAGFFASPSLADSITGPTTSPGGNSITGPTINSTNSATVTSTGNFGVRTTITGGRSNQIAVSAVGASVLASIIREGGDPNASTNDTIVINSITATNTATGTVTATGNFTRTRIDGGSSNGVSVSAAGTSVTLSIVHR
jgi:hypothetical protein